MATVNLTTHFTVDIDDDDSHTITGGSTTATDSITISHYFDKRFEISNLGLVEIWSDAQMANTDSDVGDSNNFNFLWIEADQAVEIQLLCNEDVTAASGGLENAFVVKIIKGVPFILGSDASRNRGDVVGAGSFTQTQYMSETDSWETNWTADIIDRIECYNSSGSTANVRLFAAI